MKNKNREMILNQPSYWIEGVNGFLYEAILNYMKKHGLNRTKLASHLGISKGRVSQILNDGEINFSIEKIIEISLKVDMFPAFEFISKDSYYKKEESLENKTISINFNANSFSNFLEKNVKKPTKNIIFKAYNEYSHQLAIN